MYSLIADEIDFIVVDKHAGASFHSEENTQGLVELIRADKKIDLWPVHRLDKATSGLLILAKNKKSCRDLCVLFEQKKIQKYYLAISDCTSKQLKKKQGLILGDMERARSGSWRLSKTKHKPAVTQFFSYSIAPNRRLFVLKPHTGKTHQLRVALKSIGAPIFGDTRYGASKSLAARMYLHAYQLHFNLAGVDYTYQSYSSEGEFALAAHFLKSQIVNPNDLSWPTLSI